jgi:hypothetical protein
LFQRLGEIVGALPKLVIKAVAVLGEPGYLQFLVGSK